jgi:hypothetical protein
MHVCKPPNEKNRHLVLVEEDGGPGREVGVDDGAELLLSEPSGQQHGGALFNQQLQMYTKYTMEKRNVKKHRNSVGLHKICRTTKIEEFQFLPLRHIHRSQ